MQTITEDVRENIKKMREFRSISPEQMATHLDMSPRAYYDFENGSTKIDLARLEKIASILEVTLDQLMHLNERSIFNTLNNHQNGQCIVANNNVYVVDREVYEQQLADLRNTAEHWREMFLAEKEERLQAEINWKSLLASKEQDFQRLLERLLP